MNILDYMRDHLLLLDGGMGSLLQAQGLTPGELPERWNISHPQVIVEIQKEYFEAGTNLLCANTFGANPLKFDEKELEELIAAAGGIVCGRATILAEGKAADRDDLVYLEKLPLFDKQGNPL